MLSSMFDVEAFILVGGQSSRMGSDKSQLVFGTGTVVEHITAALRALTPRVRLVGARDEGNSAGLQNVPDTYQRWGALGGIEAALAAAQSEWAVIVACDLPLVTAELFARLGQFAQQNQRETFEAFVPIQPDHRPQPLCAIYHRESCSAVAKQLIGEDEHKPRALLARVQTRWVNFAELSDLPGAEHFFLNVNTPTDYERAKEILAQPEKRKDGTERLAVASGLPSKLAGSEDRERRDMPK
jgi:molybdopterin-guanine dinucleotide biosynthesis protein A